MVTVLIWLVLLSVAAMVYAWAGLRAQRPGPGRFRGLRALAPTHAGLGAGTWWLVYVFWLAAMVLVGGLLALALV